MTVQATFAATLVDEWARAGMTDAVVAPGSRSTPMALALAASSMRVHVHLDERSAGFFALGLGLATGRPAAVLTTSGTATASVLPAIVEAHQARVPLIVCTADRPPELHDVGAPQTIAQDALYGGGVLRWRCDPGPPDALPPSAWRSLGARLVAEAVGGPSGPGPVHCNLAFRDPLVGAPDGLPPGRGDGAQWHRAVTAEAHLSLDSLDAAPVSGRRGVVVSGRGTGDPRPVLALAERLGWPVLADPLGGCRGRDSAVVVSAFDAVLRDDRWAGAHRPEVVVRVGAPPASKVLAGWLGASGAVQIVADPFATWPDPERTASVLMRARGDQLCAALAASSPASAPADWADDWSRAERAAQDVIAVVLASHPEPTEPGVARAVTDVVGRLGDDAALVVSSSMPVRDVEWFGSPAPGGRVLANRGANGIDGVASTALGVAAGTGGPTMALLGDLAFLHDSGGLLWAAGRGLHLTFVVVDNDGGGIFSFLPQAAELPPAQFEQLFGTPHGVDLADLARLHRLPVAEPTAAADVGPALGEAIAAGGVRVVLVRTDRTANVAMHAELHAAVAAAL